MEVEMMPRQEAVPKEKAENSTNAVTNQYENRTMPRHEESVATTPTNKEVKPGTKKGPTTIFPKKKVQPSKRKEFRRMEEARKADFNSSDDDDLLRAAEDLEKIVTPSDEELMEAVLAIENVEIEGTDEEEKIDIEETGNIPNLKLSSGMLSRHPGRNQEWKGGHDGQGGRDHGQGGAQDQGVAHQHGQGGRDHGQ